MSDIDYGFLIPRRLCGGESSFPGVIMLFTISLRNYCGYSSQLINMNNNHYTNENYEFELPFEVPYHLIVIRYYLILFITV
jgi:hypothetical protein